MESFGLYYIIIHSLPMESYNSIRLSVYTLNSLSSPVYSIAIKTLYIWKAIVLWVHYQDENSYRFSSTCLSKSCHRWYCHRIYKYIKLYICNKIFLYSMLWLSS